MHVVLTRSETFHLLVCYEAGTVLQECDVLLVEQNCRIARIRYDCFSTSSLTCASARTSSRAATAFAEAHVRLQVQIYIIFDSADSAIRLNEEHVALLQDGARFIADEEHICAVHANPNTV